MANEFVVDTHALIWFVGGSSHLGANARAAMQDPASIPLEAYQAVQAKEARNTLLGPKAKELRYARIEDAQQAHERLQQALPGSSWAVIEELATES